MNVLQSGVDLVQSGKGNQHVDMANVYLTVLYYCCVFLTEKTVVLMVINRDGVKSEI